MLDSRTHPLIENCMQLIDLLHEGIMSIELIEHAREPNMQHDAVYILTPADFNVRRVIEDLSQLRGPQLYAGGHIFFIDGMHLLSPQPPLAADTTFQLYQKMSSTSSPRLQPARVFAAS